MMGMLSNGQTACPSPQNEGWGLLLACGASGLTVFRTGDAAQKNRIPVNDEGLIIDWADSSELRDLVGSRAQTKKLL